MPKPSSARPLQPSSAVASGSRAEGHSKQTLILDSPAHEAQETGRLADLEASVEDEPATRAHGTDRAHASSAHTSIFAVAAPRADLEKRDHVPTPTVEASADKVSVSASTRASDRKSAQARPRAGSRPMPWEAAAAVLFVGTTAAGSFALPREAAPVHAVERRVAEPIVIMPTVPSWATWEVKARAAVSFVSMQAPLRRGGVVVGEAPMAGQVSRVRVREGQIVGSGDRILTLATSTTNVAPRMAARQSPNTSRAERRQVQAVRRKEALELRIATARQDYDRSQSRLDEANKRLAEARALLQRIARGEAVPAPNDSRATRRAGRRTRRADASAQAKVEAAQDEKRAALSAASGAEDAARSAQSRARTQTYAVSSAQSRERSARGEVDSARSKLKSTEAQFEAGTVKADALEEARTRLSQAESALSDASKKVESSQTEARGVQSEAEEARSQAAAASGRVAQAVRNLRTQQGRAASASETEEEAAPETQSTGANTLSVSAAARLVREAISEAGTAAQDARRLKARVESYKGSATDISADIQDSARSIERAQQQEFEQELDTTIATNLSSVRAPVAGTVLSIASVGESVSPGDPIVRIARGPQGLEATMEDRTDAWKLLRPGMLLPGRLLSPEQAAAQASGANQSTTTGRSPLVGGEPVTLKVREIEAPVGPSDAAEVRVGVVPGSGNASARRIVAIAVPRGKGALLSIPEGSVARGASNQPIVGVLREVPAQIGGSAPEPASPTQVLAPAPNTNSSAGARPAERFFEVEWRAVGLSDALPSTISNAPTAPDEVLVGDEKMKKVISGLVPGERILRNAAQWQARLSSTAPGLPTRVRLDVS